MMKLFVVVLFITFVSLISCQEEIKTEHFNYFKDLRDKELESLVNRLALLDSTSLLYQTISWELELLQTGVSNELIHKSICEKNAGSSFNKTLKELHYGEYCLQNNLQNIAFDHFRNAFHLSKKMSDSVLVCKSLNGILFVISRATDNDSLQKKRSQDYLRKYEVYAYDELERFYVEYYRNYFKLQSNFKIDKTELSDKIIKEYILAQRANNYFGFIEYYQKNGVYLEVLLDQPDTALAYYDKALTIIEGKPNYHFLQERVKGLHTNIGIIHYFNEDYASAEKEFNKAYSIKSTKKRIKNDIDLTNWRAKNYLKLNRIDSAALYFGKKDSLYGVLNQLELTAKIEESERKYNVDLARSKTRLSIMLFSVSIVLILIASHFSLRYQKGKRFLLEKEKEVLIKDRELMSIDAMIKGQEKERQLIAQELHRDFGNILATIRLYFKSFQTRMNEIDMETNDMIDKTSQMLDDASDKVRTIAHFKHAHNLVPDGLIESIRKYASTVADSGQIEIEILHYNFENARLNDTLKNILFSTTTELILNVIKHSEANKASVSLTNHEDHVNLIVSDNGVGFEEKDIENINGIGLDSIKSWVKKLNGNIHIDTNRNRGATIIIDFPRI